MTATPPYRADHVGRLLRPGRLLRTRADGTITHDRLREVADSAIRVMVAEQENVGLRTATDGEFRRTYWHMDFIEQLGGIAVDTEHTRAVEFRNETGTVSWQAAPPVITGRIHLRHTIFGEDFTASRGMTSPATPILTSPSPSMVHYRDGRSMIPPGIYADAKGFWADLSAAHAAEVRGLADLGCRYLQLDDTSLAYRNDPRQRAMAAARGDDPGVPHLRYIPQINAALEHRPADLTVTTHLCRGNFRSSWVAERGYDHVAEALFNELAGDGFFLEFDDARSGGF